MLAGMEYWAHAFDLVAYQKLINLQNKV